MPRARRALDPARRPPWQRVLAGGWSALWILGALTAGWFLWPTSLGGCTTLTIVSGTSMEPTYHTGDLVVARCGPVEVGDVVVYHPPEIEGAKIIHRVVAGSEADGWIIQGDNNDFLDPWQPTSEHVLGSAAVHIPHAGKVASILVSPMAWFSVLLIALALVVWPSRTEQPPSDEDGPSGPEGPGPASVDPPPLPEAERDLFEQLGVRRVAEAVTRHSRTAGDALASLPAALASLGSRRHRRRAALRALVVAAVALPLAAGAGVANAARLDLGRTSLATFGAGDRCSDLEVAATNTGWNGPLATHVTLTIPEGCGGASGRLTLVGVDTVVDVPLAAVVGSMELDVPDYAAADVVDVALVLDGRGMATGWSFTPPPLPAPHDVVTNVDTRVALVLGPWTEVEGRQCVPVDLQHAKEGNRAWVLDVDVTAFPFDGTVPTFGGAHGAWVLTAPSPTAGWIRLTGQPPYDQVHQVQQPEISFTICS